MVELKGVEEGGIVLFDFNRTLQDTAEYSIAVNRYIKQTFALDVSSEMKKRQAEVEERGDSFDIIANLEELVGTKETEDFKASFMEYAREKGLRFLNPGAEEILATLKKLKIAHAILTRGTPEAQKYSLQISQLTHIPHLIIDRTDKARMIREEWVEDDGRIRVPPEIAMGDIGLFSCAVLVEDRVLAFEDPPEGTWVYGAPRGFFGNYYIDRRREQLVSQVGSIPPQIITIHDLRDIQLPPRPL